jgi:hypothetical protein
MWEALFAFHICIACISPEFFRCPVVERTVRAFAVVLPPPACQSASYIIERAEPVGVEALVAQPSLQAFNMAILHRPSWLANTRSELRPPRIDPRKTPFNPAKYQGLWGAFRLVRNRQCARRRRRKDQSHRRSGARIIELSTSTSRRTPQTADPIQVSGCSCCFPKLYAGNVVRRPSSTGPPTVKW